MVYRVTMVVVHLGWVDSDLGSSPGRWAVTAAICCPTGGWNILNLSQPNPGARPPWSPCRGCSLYIHPILLPSCTHELCDGRGREASLAPLLCLESLLASQSNHHHPPMISGGVHVFLKGRREGTIPQGRMLLLTRRSRA